METAPDIVFYDGNCGLCHWTIRFLVAADRAGTLFRYAPLGSPVFERLFPPEARRGLPDSIIVRDNSGQVRAQSSAVIYLLHRLGGPWRSFAIALSFIPRPLRDGAYRAVAAIRQRVFAKPRGVCPVMAPELAKRFDLVGPETSRSNFLGK